MVKLEPKTKHQTNNKHQDPMRLKRNLLKTLILSETFWIKLKQNKFKKNYCLQLAATLKEMLNANFYCKLV